MDGFAVCRRIRAESVVPIIFLTALEAISERVAGLDLGADDYLSKPFSPKELEARIATILRRMGPTVSVTESKEVPSGKGVMKFGSLVVDDEPAVLKVLVTRLQLAGYQVYSATNGEEALESFHRDSPDLIVLDLSLIHI